MENRSQRSDELEDYDDHKQDQEGDKKKISCSFCQHKFENPLEEGHECSKDIYALLNDLARFEFEAPSVNNIDNLVFQGGGVLGLAYLGVVEELNKQKLLENIKRIAGTSAGSLISLYLGLNMTVAQISKLMHRSYAALLDEDVSLRVIINPTTWFFNVTAKRSVRDIVLNAIDLFNEIVAAAADPKKKDWLDEKFSEISVDMANYFVAITSSPLFKVPVQFGNFLATPGFARKALDWVFMLLTPKAENPSQFTSALTHIVKTTQLAPTQEKKPPQQTVKEVVGSHHKQVFDVSDHAPKKANGNANGNGHSDVTRRAPGSSANANNENNIDDDEDDSDDDGTSKDRGYGVLVGTQLHYALAQLTYFMLFDSTDYDGNKCDLFLFSADKIKKEIIEDVIQSRLAEVRLKDNKSYHNPKPTFKDLSLLTDATGKAVCKPFYVAAFNTSLLRTEIFSAEHTPNVVVADAVRASMSIPVFFKAVEIEEVMSDPDVAIKDRDIQSRRTYYKDGNEIKYTVTRYMDGGVFDNYPIWIFDDLKYCLSRLPVQPKMLNAVNGAEEHNASNVQNAPNVQNGANIPNIPNLPNAPQKWANKKITIRNHRTLGFKFLSPFRIEAYKQPFFDTQCTQLKQTSWLQYGGNVIYMALTMGQAEALEHEESTFINDGNWTRTAYMNNYAISPVAFNLTSANKKDLMKGGRDAVRDYIKRISTNFAGEGIKYLNQDFPGLKVAGSQ